MRALSMPRRFLRGAAGRMLLTVLAVACGVALVCAIDLVNRAVYDAFVQIIDTMAGRTALSVSAGGGALIPEDTAATLSSVPGVELAIPVVSSWAFTTDGTEEQLAVHGVDVTNDAAVRAYEPSAASPELDDPIIFLNHRDSIVLTERFAERHKLHIDDTIDLDTPTGRQRFTVRALLAPQGIGRVQGGNLVVMDIAAAQLAFARPGLVDRVDVVVRPDADVQTTRDAIVAASPPGFHVEAPEQRRMDLQRIMHSVQTLLQAVGILGLFAAFLIAFSRLSATFEARVGQLAVLRAVGIRARAVWWELIKESGLVALAGIALGIPLGVLLGRALLPLIATTTAIGAKLMTAETTVAVRMEPIAVATALGLTAVLLAAVLPARRAAQRSIIATLRNRNTDDETSTIPFRVGLSILVAAAGATIWHIASGTAGTGLLASALVTTTVAVSTLPLVRSLGPMLTRTVPRFGGVTARYAVSMLVRAPRRTAVTIATLGVGFGGVLWLWTIARSFEQSVIEVMPGVLRGDLAVSSANIGAGYVEASLDERILDDVRAISGVDTVIGEQTADWRYADGPIALNAFDPSYFEGTSFGTWRLTGRSLPDAGASVARGDSVLVSENFVHNIGYGVGNVLTLDTPSGPVSLRIAGMTPDFLSPRGTVILSRAVYGRLWQDPHVTHALVRVRSGEDVEAVRERIARALGRRYHIRVLRIDELVAWFSEQVRRAFAGLNVLAALVLVVVMVGVGDTLAAGTIERTRELGIVRAIGLRRRVLGLVVAGEALIIGLLGVFLAIAFGLGLGLLWVVSTFPALLGWTLSLHLPLVETLELCVASLAVSLLAASVPAFRTIRLDPVEALRTE